MRRDFTIPSSEGLPIRGVLEMPATPRCLVVVAHGFKGFKDWGFFPWISERLTRASAAAIRFDFSRNGIGDRPGEFDRLDLFAGDNYSQQVADLHAVVEWSAGIDALAELPVFLFGHSRGGGVTILAAPRVPRLRGLIVWASIAQADRWDEATRRLWRERGRLEVINSRTGQVMPMSTAPIDDLDHNRERLDIERAMASLEIPVLVVHGGRDESVPVEEALRLTEAARNPSLVIIGSAGHTFGVSHPFDGVNPDLACAMHATLGFLTAYSRQSRISMRAQVV